MVAAEDTCRAAPAPPALTFVTPIAYDYTYAFDTIRSYYAIADEIILGLDAARRSFSGHRYPFDEEAFAAGIAAVDVDNKIRIIEGDFHSQPHPLMNDHHKRLTLANAAKSGHWIMQIDSDEVLLNAAEFREWMATAPATHGVRARWLTVFKRLGQDLLVIREPDGRIPVGTRQRHLYRHLRELDQPCLDSPLVLLHFAYGRSRSEIELKLKNWGHSREVDHQRFLQAWDHADLENFHSYRNFHPLYAPWWEQLEHLRIEPSAQQQTPR